MFLKRPSLEIAANLAYTDKELESVSNVLKPVFEVKVKRFEEFQEEILEPIILFIFYGISSGFFQGIGRNLWNVIKKKVANIVTKKRKSGVSDLEFRVKTEKRNIQFRLHSSDPKVVEKAVDQFPKALEYAQETGCKINYYEFDTEKKKWVH